MRFVLLFFLASLPAASTAAQANTIPSGTRVKIETQPKTQVVGKLLSQLGDSIIITGAGSHRIALASDAVTRVEVSRGRSHVHGALRGMKVGSLAVGGGVGLIVGAAYIDGYSDRNSIVPLYVLVFSGAAVGAVYGAAIGGILGAERWSTLYSAPMRVSFGPVQSGAPGVGVSIRF